MTESKRPDYEQLGKAVESALITDYLVMLRSTRSQIWSSFVRGVVAGLGGVIGATLGVALLVALLQMFGGVPVIGRYLENAGHTIQSRSHPGAANTGSSSPANQ